MRPESRDNLETARQFLKARRAELAIGINGDAARAAYLAAFRAAQAFVFERTGKAPKTHSGVRGQFGRLAKDEPSIDARLQRFLHESYDLKTETDYGQGPMAALPEDARKRSPRPSASSTASRACSKERLHDRAL